MGHPILGHFGVPLTPTHVAKHLKVELSLPVLTTQVCHDEGKPEPLQYWVFFLRGFGDCNLVNEINIYLS